ncbi:MAG: hypothetical protein ACE5HA_03245 [Anaerolineae bacterium]
MHIQRIEFVTVCAVLLLSGALAVVLRPAVPVVRAGPDLPAALADIPITFNYQGTLRLADGSLANGTYDITLKIYDQVTGGTVLHSETLSGVPVRDGVFNVVLGDATPIGSNVFADAPRFVGITVAPDPEMVPRQRLHPVPWALSATNAVNAIDATNAETAQTLVPGATVSGLIVNGTGDALQLSNYASGDRYIKLTTAGGNQWRTGIKLMTWQDNFGFTIESDERPGSNGLNILRHNLDQGKSALFIERSTGDVSIASDLKVTAIREVGDSANGGQKTQQPYDVSLRRYVLEATDGASTPTSVPVDENLLKQLCGDGDGCTFTLGMRDWATATYGPGLLATVGPIRLSLAGERNGQRYWSVRYENGDQLTAADGNGATNHLRQAWDCFLTDGRYENGSDLGDPAIGLALLNWHGEYNAQNMVCVLIIED